MLAVFMHDLNFYPGGGGISINFSCTLNIVYALELFLFKFMIHVHVIVENFLFYSSQIQHLQKCIHENNLINHVVMSYIIDIDVNLVI